MSSDQGQHILSCDTPLPQLLPTCHPGCGEDRTQGCHLQRRSCDFQLGTWTARRRGLAWNQPLRQYAVSVTVMRSQDHQTPETRRPSVGDMQRGPPGPITSLPRPCIHTPNSWLSLTPTGQAAVCSLSFSLARRQTMFRGPSPDSAPAAHICPHAPHCWLTGEGAQRWGSGQEGPICTYLSSQGI